MTCFPTTPRRSGTAATVARAAALVAGLLAGGPGHAAEPTLAALVAGPQRSPANVAGQAPLPPP